MIAFYVLNELYIEKTTTPPCHIFIPNKNMKIMFLMLVFCATPQQT
jgi:hypothetical protein